jgi:3-isopropylmalate dehydrogenase
MQLAVAILGGDGVGPEVTRASVHVLERVAALFEHDVIPIDIEAGASALERRGVPLTPEGFDAIAGADALLFGAVGGEGYAAYGPERSPERMLLRLRKSFELYANVRPIRLHPALVTASPLRAEIVNGADFVVVRELNGGLYYGEPSGRRDADGVRAAVDTLAYDEREIERIAVTAFELASARRNRVTSVDKANVLSTSRLWREIVNEVAVRYPQVTLDHLLVDNAAMKLVSNPRAFDVIVTENMFGDILTDEAAVVAGSIGLLPSASLGAKTNRHGKPFGLYEPIHGSAPDIAGRDIANPIGSIASLALMLRHSFGLEREAAAVERAIDRALDDGTRSADLIAGAVSAKGTVAIGEAIASRIRATT